MVYQIFILSILSTLFSSVEVDEMIINMSSNIGNQPGWYVKSWQTDELASWQRQQKLHKNLSICLFL